MLTTLETDAQVGQWFASPFAWDRNHKGNLWRRWKGMSLTIFKRGPWFSFCISGGKNNVTFSRRAYRTESAAMDALADALTRNMSESS